MHYAYCALDQQSTMRANPHLNRGTRTASLEQNHSIPFASFDVGSLPTYIEKCVSLKIRLCYGNCLQASTSHKNLAIPSKYP